jgi:glycerol uptake facilitator-like aquaporin
MGEDNHGCCHHLKYSISKLLYEFIGTLLFTMVFLSTAIGSGRIIISLWILTVFCWKISGSHFNPAISFAYLFRRDSGGLPRMLALLYMVAQIGGAYVGGLLMTWLQDEL